MNQKILDKLKELADRDCLDDSESFNAEHVFISKYEAYYAGQYDGQTNLARELLEMLKEQND